jgi:hypothetical protein
VFPVKLFFVSEPTPGLTYRQVKMLSKQRNPKTVMRYVHGRENLDLNAVDFLQYEEE